MDSDSRATDLDARLATTFGLHSFCLELPGEDCVEVQPGPGLANLLHVVAPGGGYAVASLRAAVDPAVRGVFDAWWLRLAAGNPVSVELRRAGDRGHVRIWASSRVTAGRRVVEGFGIDLEASGIAAVSPYEHLGRIAESLEEHLYTAQFDEDGRYSELYTGPGGDRFLGPIPEGVDPVAAWDEQVYPDDLDAMNEAYAARMRGCSNEVVYRLRGFDGVTRWVSDRGYADRQADGRVIVDGIVSDITGRKVAEERLNGALRALEEARRDAELRARTDYLTGAHNRAHFAEALAAELDRAGRESRKTGLALIDVDHFKLVNDRYGHLTGDAVLVEVARRLRAILREYDTLARWGGEEFAILAPGIESPGQLEDLAQRIRACVSDQPFEIPPATIHLTASVGAVLASGLTTPDHLVRATDTLLYRAKELGRDRVELEARIADAA